ncbi:MAG TPA: Do family serine endopeptidase [Aquifex aeolicus]|uniref:Do family serine endopeptidase n=1 Tax=Aquifex aeolicus TaxID=63363 RepID=A0A9D1CFF7_AQUAO|nr:Do family serine endopeptidase [Aquifex aeolicus]
MRKFLGKKSLAVILFGSSLLGFAQDTTLKEGVKSPPVLTPVLSQAQEELHRVINKVAPSVVTIFTYKEIKVIEPFSPPGFEEFKKLLPPELRNLLPFFGQPKIKKQRALGSGFIFKVDDNWVYILTNNHVVTKAKKIVVKIERLKEVTAQLVGADPKTDLAVLKIPKKEVPDADKRVAKLGDSSKVRVGDLVLALGNPFGLENTATFGIVSALHRRIGLDLYENFIQTQAPINPGNSGGPLVNIQGEVIGINTAIVAYAQGLGFAIPINLAKWVAKELLTHGKVVRGWLGVVVQELTPPVAQALGLDHGVIVLKVYPGSPAQNGGVEPGDIILAVNGEPVKDATDLQFKIMKTPPGKEITLTILRGEKKLTLKVKVGEFPEKGNITTKAIYYNLGLVLRNPSKEELQQYRAPYGVIVSNVYPGSPAAQVGIKPGMLIVRVNNIPVRSVDEFRKVVEKLAKNKKPIVLFLKDLEGNFFVATIENY